MKNWDIQKKSKWIIGLGTGDYFFGKEDMTLQEVLFSLLLYYPNKDKYKLFLINKVLQGFSSAEELIDFFTKYFTMQTGESIGTIIPLGEQYFIDENFVPKIFLPKILKKMTKR